jgi:2,4-dienoyl-CoA reductase-like NADH-dependent reductase (Old Yellow Enzyme family)
MGDKLGGDVIFEPLKWRNIGIKNRIFRSSISGRWDNEDGSLTQVRVNWESQFAKGGVGAIISSFVPVLMAGLESSQITGRSIATTSSHYGLRSERRSISSIANL